MATLSHHTDRHSHRPDQPPTVDVALVDRLETLRQLEREAKQEHIAAHDAWAEADTACQAARRRLQRADTYLQGIQQAAQTVRELLPAEVAYADTVVDDDWQAAS